jgi:hypothetical protein
MSRSRENLSKRAGNACAWGNTTKDHIPREQVTRKTKQVFENQDGFGGPEK